MSVKNVKAQFMKRALRGFSLIEIMVVVTLMAILIALGTVYFMGQLQEGRIEAARAQAYEISKALDLYKLKMGNYPSSAEGIEVLTNPSRGEPLMQSIPKDPWGREYNYEIPGTHNPKGFDVWSDGPNGEGGEEAIGNWRPEPVAAP